MTNKSRKPSANIIKWDEIFRPYGFPEHTFVKRDIYIKVVKEFLTTHCQSRVLAIQGPSQSGKTRLMEHVLRELPQIKEVKISGWMFKSIEEFKYVLSTELGLSPMEEGSQFGGRIVGALEFLFSRKRTKPVTDIDILRKLHRSVLIIDDFHKVSSSLQGNVFEWLKVQLERKEMRSGELDIKFCVIYIPNKPSTAPSVVTELGLTRIQPLKVQLWDTKELEEIARHYIDQSGNTMLGLRAMANASHGLPALMQLLCLEYCKTYHPNSKPGQTIYVHENELVSVLERTAQEGWQLFTYQQLTGQGTLDQQSLPIIQIPHTQLAGNIHQLIWYVLSCPQVPKEIRKLLLPLQYSEAVEVPLSVLQQRLEKICQKTFTINELRIQVELLARNADTQYRAVVVQQSTEQSDPLFEMVGDRIVIHSPRILFELSYAPSHLDQLRSESD